MLRMQSGIVFEWDEVGKNVLSQTQKRKPWKKPWHFVFLWTLSRSPVDAAHDNDEIVQGNAAVTSSSCWLLSFFLLFSTRISSQEVTITSFPPCARPSSYIYYLYGLMFLLPGNAPFVRIGRMGFVCVASWQENGEGFIIPSQDQVEREQFIWKHGCHWSIIVKLNLLGSPSWTTVLWFAAGSL